MFVVDAFLGNFDSHGGNWGFLKKDNKYRLAPVFDKIDLTKIIELIARTESITEVHKEFYGYMLTERDTTRYSKLHTTC